MILYRRQKGVHHHRAMSTRPSSVEIDSGGDDGFRLTRTEVYSSAYVVQIDSSRESLYLMRLPNGVRLKRCSHHRRKSSPARRHVNNN